MNKYLVSCILLVLVSFSMEAQKGKNQLEVIAEGTVPIFQNDRGIGGFIKGLYGVGKSAQLTLTAGVAGFKSKNDVEVQETRTRLIPVLAGYKQNLNGFYIELQVGYGEFGGKIKLNGGDYARPSEAAFFWAIGAGYGCKRIDVGIRYQSARGTEGISRSIRYENSFHYVGVHVGYNIF